ncbi:serine hydrolase domain-containing protein [Peribacillus kribbensis]|uniref:serine hydrolase domain-containing protein n=1 Tax=Peribacillus kribbensis TaxID=356658 RepID=UPI0004138DB8|nr:serine hydrolase domain-containing protein [Peribacillus kribbensis]
MKKNIILFSSISSVLLGSSIASASGESPVSMEKAVHKSTDESLPPSPVFSWDSQILPMPGVLHPGSPRSAGMVEKPLNDLDGILNKAISEKVMPGAVALVARAGHIVKQDAYGYAAQYQDDSLTPMDQPVKMKEDTIFDLASISKIFTSTAIMMLYEKGRINLDAPVADYIPEFAQSGKSQVTIRQLLTHTSGFTAWIPLYTMGASREDRLQLVFKQPLLNKPGTVYTYSDLNMITLGAIVERLSGKRLDDFVKEYITGPLKMKDTMYNPPASLKARIAATEYQKTPARGLVWGQVHDENAWSLDGVAGHAGVFSTAEDLAKFAYIFINNGRYGGKQILKPETVKLLLENQNAAFPGNDHGLGWELGQGWYMDALSDSASFGHTGYTGTSIVVSPSQKTIAILLTNRVHPSRNTVSTNQTRRLFARQVADSIPVSIPGRKAAWFSGYGDNLNKAMEAEVHIKKAVQLTFSTWYSLENGADTGKVEIWKDGSWQSLYEVTGTSSSWQKKQLTLPQGTEKIRFVYKTDGSVNGRGWYVMDAEIDHKKLNFSSNDWQTRNY